MVNKITFLGMGLDSPNKGVNALCIGATEVVSKSYKFNEIFLISFRKNTPTKEYNLSTSYGDVKIINKFFTKKDLIIALKDTLLFKLFKINPKSELCKVIVNSDIIFDLNEGDSFSDIYGLKRIIRHFLDSFISLSYNKKLIFLPQTIGPFKTSLGTKMGLYILKRLEKLYVRDTKAKDFLESNKLEYIETIDLAVYMKPKEVNYKIPENSIFININGLMYFNNYASLANQFNEYKNLLLEIVDYFKSLEKTIVFIPHTYDTINTMEEDDLVAINDFINTNNIENVTVIDQEFDAQELKYLISKSEFFIGSRMHSCIAALSTSITTIGLSYSYKFNGTFSMFNVPDTVIELNNIKNNEVNSILQKIKKIYENKKIYEKELLIQNDRNVLEL